MSDSRIEKLPKWAQDHIRRVERQRDIAQDALTAYEDNQTESPIYFEDLLCDGRGDHGNSQVTKYINGTNRVIFEKHGIRLTVTITDEGPCHSDGIHLQWGNKRGSLGEVAMVPESFQTVRLVSRENMRKR